MSFDVHISIIVAATDTTTIPITRKKERSKTKKHNKTRNAKNAKDINKQIPKMKNS